MSSDSGKYPVWRKRPPRAKPVVEARKPQTDLSDRSKEWLLSENRPRATSDLARQTIETMMKTRRLKETDGTIDTGLIRRADWLNVQNGLSSILDIESKRQECCDKIAEQEQILAAFCHALAKAVLSASPLATRLAYEDLARYCGIVREK